MRFSLCPRLRQITLLDGDLLPGDRRAFPLNEGQLPCVRRVFPLDGCLLPGVRRVFPLDDGPPPGDRRILVLDSGLRAPASAMLAASDMYAILRVKDWSVALASRAPVSIGIGLDVLSGIASFGR